MDFKLMKIHL